MVTTKEKQKTYRLANRDKIAKRGKTYRLANPDKIKKQRKAYNLTNRDKNKAYYLVNRDKIKKRMKAYQLTNRDKIKKQRKAYRLANPDKNKDWCLANRDKRNASKRKCHKKYMENPIFRINNSISNQIWVSLKGKKAGRHWETLVGYTIHDLMKHLEAKFKDGMNWNNRNKWHIDHVKPKSLFNYETTEDPEFLKCWSLNNLQPLWALENLQKSNKYIG